MKVVRECHMHNSKLSTWCNYCQQKQIEDCKTCHGKRIESISEILSSKGHTRTEYKNALKSVMNHIYCEDCADAQGFDPHAEINVWPYESEIRKRFEETINQKPTSTK